MIHKTEIEMTEWLAVTLLGWEHYPDSLNKGKYFVRYMGQTKNRKLDYSFGSNGMSQLLSTIQEFIYSANGFIAVVKSLRDEPVLEDERFIETWKEFLFDPDYGTFYNAIHDVMK